MSLKITASCANGGAAQAYEQFRRERDTLFQTHPQSALDEAQKAAFQGLRYLPLRSRVSGRGEGRYAVEPVVYEYDLEGDGHVVIRQFAQVTFDLPTGSGTLGLFWIAGYGGGVFLPFRDATNGNTTYGGGRYLYDTIKGADLGTGHDEIICSTSTTPIIRRATIIRAGSARLHRRRIA